MNPTLRIVSIFLCAFIGWTLEPHILELSLRHYQEPDVYVYSIQMTNQLWHRVVMALIFGLVPVLLWMISGLFHYKKRAFELIGLFLMFGMGTLFLDFRSHYHAEMIGQFGVKEFFTNSVVLDTIEINEFLFYGVLIGLFLYLTFGLILNQLTLKRNYDRQKKLADEDIGRIGNNED